MKKYYFNWMTFLLVAVVSTNLASCGDDDISDNIEDVLTASAWTSNPNYDLMVWGDNNLSISKEIVTLFFMGNGNGIGKSITKEVDSYFGSSLDKIPYTFSYVIDGSTVRIDNQSYTYKDGKYLMDNGQIAFTKKTISSDDMKWLESVQYYLLPDEERLNFDIFHGCAVEHKISDNKYMITLGVGVQSSAHAYSRGITSILARYKIKDGQFQSKETPENVIIISADEDYNTSIMPRVTTTAQATITADFYYFDKKDKKEKYASSVTYKVPAEKDTTGEDDNDEDDNDEDEDDNDEDEDEDDNDNGNGNYVYTKTGTVQGHDYVDLGLSVNWATCNVGASLPEEFGDYFAWGETSGYINGKTDFSWETYKWCKGTKNTLIKYCTSDNYGRVDNKTKLESSDDAATVNWGSKWQTPTSSQVKELINKCSWTWTTLKGVRGYKVKSKTNNNSIFLPAAGCRKETEYSFNENGCYWTSSLISNSHCYHAQSFFFLSNSIEAGYIYRYQGRNVRPVIGK